MNVKQAILIVIFIVIAIVLAAIFFVSQKSNQPTIQQTLPKQPSTANTSQSASFDTKDNLDQALQDLNAISNVSQ